MLVLALVAALVLTVRIEEWRLAAQRRRSAAALLVVSNWSAERDTTRDLALENSRVAKLLGDSLRLVEKQVVQTSQTRDALDRALGRERVARYSATAVVDSLARVVAARDSPVGNTAPERRVATFHVRQEPYTIDAEAELPPPPDSAMLQMKVAVDPIPIEARVTCAEILEGSRVATVSVRAPEWARVRLGAVSQSPDVCATQRPRSDLTRRFMSLVSLASPHLVVGAGRAWSTDRRGRWSIFVGAAIAL
jgi:hypothetical protein